MQLVPTLRDTWQQLLMTEKNRESTTVPHGSTDKMAGPHEQPEEVIMPRNASTGDLPSLHPSSRLGRSRSCSRLEGLGRRRRSQSLQSRSSIVIEDRLHLWNLDIETGQIEQDVLKSLSVRMEEKELMQRERCCRCTRYLERIEEYGGDFPRRATEALRSAVGSCLMFSSLVFTTPTYLGAIWIGNIFFHTALRGNLGESLSAAGGFASSIAMTTLVSWPISIFLLHTTTLVARTCLPFLTVVLSLGIMTCPHITSPSLMILVMYVVIASPVVFRDSGWWEPLGYMASYWIGLGFAVFMHVLPIIPPFFVVNTASRQAHNQLEKLSKDIFSLFVQTRHYTYSTGESPQVARAAGAAIEVVVPRMIEAIYELKRLLPFVKLERSYLGRRADRLEQWIHFLIDIVTDLKMLRYALNTRFLGEQQSESTSNVSTNHIRRIIASELGQDYHSFIDNVIHVMVACNRQADPTQITAKRTPLDARALCGSTHRLRRAFGRAIYHATQKVVDQDSSTSLPIFAHLARRSTSTNSLLYMASTLVTYCNACLDEEEPQTQKADKSKKKILEEVVGRFRRAMESVVNAVWDPKWLWRDSQKRRLALKTAVGMFFASLWIAVPPLWEIAKPFGLWPGLTVASVNLATTGSSFHKAMDRLVGTLFAAAYALLVVEFFSGDQDFAKIPAIMVFTFVVIYLKKEEHAYQYSYAATSIGSMMYGSVKNDFDVEGYIPQRIQLIFLGVIIFAIVELLLFPRSSRRVIEHTVLDFFDHVAVFFRKARQYAVTIENAAIATSQVDGQPKDSSESDALLDELRDAEGKMRSTSLTLKNELQSALLEPYLGFSQKFHAQSLNGIVSEICESETHALLLMKALEMLASVSNTNGDGAHLQTGWSGVYASLLERVAEHMTDICRGLAFAFPDGRIRPQQGNTLRAITAAASFREFRDIRFDIVGKWSDNFRRSAAGASPEDAGDLIILAQTASFILELCRHLQLAGRGMEWMTGHYPS